MSSGTMCLSCRKYFREDQWGCKCATPVPSDDGITPNPPAADRLAQTVTDAMAQAAIEEATVSEFLSRLDARL